jgi:LuxR family maltose regulon positive regulatory protein
MTPTERNADAPASAHARDPSSLPLIETKLYVPRWSDALVGRPVLTQRISEGIRGKLTVISAPAGSGKTTLLAEWLADGRRAGWVSLDQGDNDPLAFWLCVIRALQTVRPHVAQRALDALQGEGSVSTAALTVMINELNAIDEDLTLILDDYHVIDAPGVHSGLAFFLDHLPARMRVVIATRTEPLLPLARMRARGEVTELRVADLRFTETEAATFFNRVMTLDLSPRDASTLTDRAEGWIAGMKLAALSMKGSQDVRRFIDAFGGDTRYIADYLVEEVLQQQPEHVRRFLVTTSVLERLNAQLCDAVTGEHGSQAILELLEARNLFVVALDDRRTWYRYHHLFADVLQAYARREDPERVRARHRHASDWYERHGSAEDAVRHALAGEDLDRVAELHERFWPAMDRSYQTARWLARVKALPPQHVRKRPVLWTGYAWGLLNAGELEAADVELSGVEALLAHVRDGANGAIAVSDSARFSALPRELALARVYLAQAIGDQQSTVEHATRALSLAPEEDHAARATASALLALAWWAAGDLNAAHRIFTDALSSMRQAGEFMSAIRGVFVLGDLRAIQGRLREAQQIYESGLQLASETAQSGNAETDELYLGLSELYYERGDLAESARLLHTMAQFGERTVHTGNRHRWCIGMARIAAAQGEHERALQLLAEASVRHRRDPLPQVRPIAAMMARINIARGNMAEASAWARERHIGTDDELSYLREYEYITLARLLMARARADGGQQHAHRALALLERLGTAATEGGRLGAVIETTLLRALSHQLLGDARAALDALVAALELAEDEGYVRVFLDEGNSVRDLLRQAAARGLAGDRTRRLLAAFDGHTTVTASVAQSVAAAAPAAQLLTPRELEILRLVSVGMRNKEIATQLFISTATVKRHIANVYDKLNARHRTEALRRAAELSLL